MKQWLAIFLLIWCTATLCASEGRASHPATVEICTTTISSNEEHIASPDTIPLVATSTSTLARLVGTELPASGKGGRNTGPTATTLTHATTPHHQATQPSATPRHTLTPPNTHTSERYIYFLRRIII